MVQPDLLAGPELDLLMDHKQSTDNWEVNNNVLSSQIMGHEPKTHECEKATSQLLDSVHESAGYSISLGDFGEIMSMRTNTADGTTQSLAAPMKDTASVQMPAADVAAVATDAMLKQEPGEKSTPEELAPTAGGFVFVPIAVRDLAEVREKLKGCLQAKALLPILAWLSRTQGADADEPLQLPFVPFSALTPPEAAPAPELAPETERLSGSKRKADKAAPAPEAAPSDEQEGLQAGGRRRSRRVGPQAVTESYAAEAEEVTRDKMDTLDETYKLKLDDEPEAPASVVESGSSTAVVMSNEEVQEDGRAQEEALAALLGESDALMGNMDDSLPGEEDGDPSSFFSKVLDDLYESSSPHSPASPIYIADLADAPASAADQSPQEQLQLLQQQALLQQQTILRMTAQAQAQMSSGVNLANVINLAGGMNFLQQQQSRFMPMMQQDKNGFAAGSGTAEQQAVQHPFSPAKGWFAYHSNGRQVQLLERLHVLLETPDMPLQKTAGKKMSDVLRWIPQSALKGLGVPKGTAAFELVDSNLFRNEVFPQGRSSSFRKFAKDWGLVSPKDPAQAPGTMRKINYKCMYLPMAPEEGGVPGRDPTGVFRHQPSNTTTEAVELYAQTHLKPIDDALNVRLPPNDLLEADTTWGEGGSSKWEMPSRVDNILGPDGKPIKAPRRTAPLTGQSLRWSVTNIL